MPKYPSDGDLVELIRGLIDRIENLERANPLVNAYIPEGGITIDGDPGVLLARIGEIDPGRFGLKVVYPSGATQMLAGEANDGNVQTIFYRSTGSLAFAVGGSAGGHQFAAIYDRSSQAVISDDTISGVGIGVPYIPWGPFMSTSAPTDTTTSATFVTLQTAQGYKMNPRITAQILARASDGTTAGEARFIDEDGTQIGPTITIPAGAFAYYNLPATAFPGTFKEAKTLLLQGRVTAGSGSIGLRGMFAQGLQS